MSKIISFIVIAFVISACGGSSLGTNDPLPSNHEKKEKKFHDRMNRTQDGLNRSVNKGIGARRSGSTFSF